MKENDILLMKRIADHIRDLRMKAEWSQEDLAGEAGVHTNYIGTVERGEQIPSVEILIKIVHALGLKMSTFYAEIDD